MIKYLKNIGVGSYLFFLFLLSASLSKYEKFKRKRHKKLQKKYTRIKV